MNFCPHCHSGNDPVLKDTTWSCGVRFNDSTWRTKECYKRNLELAHERIKRLEEALSWYEVKVEDCNRHGSEGVAARNALAKDLGLKAREAKL